MARYDDLNTKAIAYATLLSCILLVIVIFGLQALTFAWINGEEEQRLENSHYTSSDKEIARQKEELAGYDKIKVEVIPETDPNAPTPNPGEEPKAIMEDRVHIPVDRAGQLLLKELVKPTEQSPKT